MLHRLTATLSNWLLVLAPCLLLAVGGVSAWAVQSTEPADRQLAIVALATGISLVAFWIVALVCRGIAKRALREPLQAAIAAARSLTASDQPTRIQHMLRDSSIPMLLRALVDMARRIEGNMVSVRQEHSKLVAILNAMAEGVVAIDRFERVLHLNVAAQGMLNYPQSLDTDVRIWQVTDQSSILAMMSAAIEYGREEMAEFTLHVDEAPRVVEFRVRTLRAPDQAIVGAVGVLEDVSAFRQLAAMRREFVANVSHELKTPLTAIRGFVETLQSVDGVPDEKRIDYLRRIERQAGRLEALVADLLLLARAQSRPDNREHRRLDLVVMVDEAASDLEPAAGAQGIAFEWEVPDHPVLVEGDAEALRRLVDNLLNNALKYTLTDGRIQVSLEVAGDEVTLAVRDTGIGIDCAHQPRIFERFYRVDSARSRSLGGTGLGLAIVKHIALAHNGDVRVDSAPERGSTFSVTLPLASRNSPSSSGEH